jgi:RNA-binding protein 26
LHLSTLLNFDLFRCDADPSALADYILALLKHNGPESELRRELAAQLDEFLEKGASLLFFLSHSLTFPSARAEGPPFIDALFTALRTKSYLPYTSPPPPPAPLLPADDGIPIPLDAIIPSGSSTPPERSRKRPSDHDDELRPPKGPRLSQDGPFSRHGPHGGPGWNNANWAGGGPGRAGYSGNGPDGVNGGMGPRMNGRGPSSQYHPPDQRKGICRDYYSEHRSPFALTVVLIRADNGYCARGAFCKYSHGEDALIPGVFPMGPQPLPGNMFMPMFPPGIPFGLPPPAAYDPHEARLDMRPGAPSGPMGRPQRPTMIPRINGDNQPMHPHASGELPVIQDLTPPVYSDESTQQPDKSASSPTVDAQPNGVSASASHVTQMELDSPGGGPSSFPSRPQRGSQNSPARGRGGRPGVFGGDVQRFHPERRGDKTLVVEKIPEDKLSLDAVNNWFKRFGTVTNVAVDAASAKALVSFSTHEEALASWKSEDAVFGNRFVKVFWHRPMDGQGLAGQRALAASAPIVASVASRDQAEATSTSVALPADSPAPSPSPAQKVSSSAASSSVSALAARQKLLDQQIAEQKALMEKLNTASAEEKKEIFAQLRKLGQEIKASSSSQPAFSPSKKPNLSASRPEDREAKERERLDKELELHSAVHDGEETTEALQAKLAKLKAEVRSFF